MIVLRKRAFSAIPIKPVGIKPTTIKPSSMKPTTTSSATNISESNMVNKVNNPSIITSEDLGISGNDFKNIDKIANGQVDTAKLTTSMI